jgi:hypothetical protein
MSLQFQETLVAGGGPQDFPTVRHLVLQGSNYEIGKQLAEIVMERYGQRKRPSGDSFRLPSVPASCSMRALSHGLSLGRRDGGETKGAF